MFYSLSFENYIYMNNLFIKHMIIIAGCFISNFRIFTRNNKWLHVFNKAS